MARQSVVRGGRVVLALVMVAAAGTADYVVERGDTLWELARRFDTSVSELAERNALSDPDRIVVGQRLVVPSEASPSGASPNSEGAAPTPGATPPHHVVQPGETLSSIAARYGIPADRLAAANGFTDHRGVWSGSRVVLSVDAPALPSAGASSEHRLAAGETLSHVARRHGISVDELIRVNDIQDPNRVWAGQVVAIATGWLCPVAGVTRMVDDWGAPRFGGRFHDGIDLFAPGGTPVVAPVSGTIRFLTGSIGGLQFVLEGDDGHRYIGTHLASGGTSGRVTAGSGIGTVGTSGNAVGSPPHLHFEVHPGGGPAANPYPLLVDAC